MLKHEGFKQAALLAKCRRRKLPARLSARVMIANDQVHIKATASMQAANKWPAFFGSHSHPGVTSRSTFCYIIVLYTNPARPDDHSALFSVLH